MKKILIPTDFSKNSPKALTYAGEIAQRTGAAIYLLHVIAPFTDRVKQPFPINEKLQSRIIFLNPSIYTSPGVPTLK